MKFSELSEKEQVKKLKEEFMSCIEEGIVNPDSLKKSMKADEFESVKKIIDTEIHIKCDCGQCIELEKINYRIPESLEPLIEVARKRCDARVY